MVRNHFRDQGDSLACLECAGNDNASPSTFSTPTANGNLSRHTSSKHGIVRGGSVKDFVETTFYSQAVLQPQNVIYHCRSLITSYHL